MHKSNKSTGTIVFNIGDKYLDGSLSLILINLQLELKKGLI